MNTSKNTLASLILRLKTGHFFAASVYAIGLMLLLIDVNNFSITKWKGTQTKRYKLLVRTYDLMTVCKRLAVGQFDRERMECMVTRKVWTSLFKVWNKNKAWLPRRFCSRCSLTILVNKHILVDMTIKSYFKPKFYQSLRLSTLFYKTWPNSFCVRRHIKTSQFPDPDQWIWPRKL